VKNLNKLKWPAATVIIAGGVCFTLLYIFAPDELKVVFVGANGLLWTIVMWLTRLARESGDDGPPSIPPPPLPPAALALTLVIACSTITGCGSAIGVQARAATVSAVATQGAARLVSDAARAEAEHACPHSLYPPSSPEMATCLAPLRARWAPADAAIGSTRAALSAWVEALEIARMAGDGEDLWAPLMTAASRLMADWEALRLVLEPLGVELPALPASVIVAGGAR
jgi:hypothetical protein